MNVTHLRCAVKNPNTKIIPYSFHYIDFKIRKSQYGVFCRGVEGVIAWIHSVYPCDLCTFLLINWTWCHWNFILKEKYTILNTICKTSSVAMCIREMGGREKIYLYWALKFYYLISSSKQPWNTDHRHFTGIWNNFPKAICPINGRGEILLKFRLQTYFHNLQLHYGLGGGVYSHWFASKNKLLLDVPFDLPRGVKKSKCNLKLTEAN